MSNIGRNNAEGGLRYEPHFGISFTGRFERQPAEIFNQITVLRSVRSQRPDQAPDLLETCVSKFAGLANTGISYIRIFLTQLCGSLQLSVNTGKAVRDRVVQIMRYSRAFARSRCFLRFPDQFRKPERGFCLLLESPSQVLLLSASLSGSTERCRDCPTARTPPLSLPSPNRLSIVLP